MHGLNKIFILGRLGNVPQCYSAKNGKKYTGLSIATDRYVPSFEDESKNRAATDWHYVRVWGPQAELCVKFLSKGQPVFIEGYLSSYTKNNDAGGSERKTSIHAVRVEFVSSPTPELTPTEQSEVQVQN